MPYDHTVSAIMERLGVQPVSLKPTLFGVFLVNGMFCLYEFAEVSFCNKDPVLLASQNVTVDQRTG